MFLSRCRLFAAGVLTLFGILGRTTLRPFGGVHEHVITPLQSRWPSGWGAQLTRRHQGSIHEGIVKKRGELRKGLVGFRPSHLARCPQDLKGRRGLGIREDAEELLCQRGPLAFGAASRFAPTRSRRNPCFRGCLLGCLGHVPEDGQQRVQWALGQASEGCHLTVVSDVQPHRWAPSMAFLGDSLPDFLLRNNSIVITKCQFQMERGKRNTSHGVSSHVPSRRAI